jgi:hypothetical protein
VVTVRKVEEVTENEFREFIHDGSSWMNILEPNDDIALRRPDVACYQPLLPRSDKRLPR